MTVIYLDKRLIGIGTVVLICTFAVGILVGHFGINSRDHSEHYVNRDTRSLKESIKRSVDAIDADKIRSYLRDLTKVPHLAASDKDKELTQWIAKEWREYGFDHVQLDSYNILLSYPDQSNPNKIYLKDQDNIIQFSSKHKEDVLRAEDDHPDFIHAYNAYAPAGDVTGELVYVNYGTVEDIQRLRDLNVSLTGKIAISRCQLLEYDIH